MLPSLRLIIMVIAAAPLFLAGTIDDVFVGIGLLYVIVLTLYTIFDALALPWRQKISIKRIMPERISLNVPTRIIFEVQNFCRRRVQIQLAEDAPETMDAIPAGCQAIFESGQRKNLEYLLTAHQRGRYNLSDVYVRVLPAMGLLYRQRQYSRPFD